MAKAKEIGPPTPISPANMMPLFSIGERQTKDVRVFLDADDECSWLPAAHLPQSVFFFYHRGQEGEYG